MGAIIGANLGMVGGLLIPIVPMGPTGAIVGALSGVITGAALGTLGGSGTSIMEGALLGAAGGAIGGFLGGGSGALIGTTFALAPLLTGPAGAFADTPPRLGGRK